MSSTSFEPPCKPLRFDATPSIIEQDAKYLIQERASLVDKLVQSYTPENAFEEGILPYIRHENSFIRKRRFIACHAGEAATAELRDAARSAGKLFSEADIELYSRKDFFEIVKAARENSKDLDPEFDQYLQVLEESFEESGLKITDQEKYVRFKEHKLKISSLQSDILKALNDDASGSWFTREDLEGLPESFLGSHIKAGNEAKNSDANVWVSTKESDSVPFFRRVTKFDVRKAYFLVCQNRGQKNIPMYRELFLLKHEAAKLLGYDNHAAFRTNYQTMKTTQGVLNFLNGVETRIKPKANECIADLLDLKTEHMKSTNQKNDYPDCIFQWDSAFYSRLLNERVCEYDDNLVTEYFSLQYSMKQLFKLFEHLFGILIKEWTPGECDTLHENVSMYTIWDKDNSMAFVGWLYIDPYPRPGKYNHFGHLSLQPGNNLDPDNAQYPASLLSCNFPVPTPDQPSLITHAHLRRLFHELGHAMHGTLSMTKCARLQGTGSTGRDYAEAVSIMFENFLWTPQHMLDCSLHYSYQSPGYAEAWAKANPGKEQPPRQLPMELIERLVKAQSVGLSLQLLGRVPLSRFDFAVHGPPSREALESMDLSAVYNKIVFDATGLHGLEVETGAWDWGHRFASLRSIATGYDAFVYCYLFSQIWAYDLFETGFKKDTMNAEMGRKYRKLVLYPGGSRPSMDILKDFLGREPNDGAFCRALGIDGLGGEMPQNGNI